MTIWLQRKEKMHRHSAHIAWILAGKPPRDPVLPKPDIPDGSLKMTKHPSKRAVQLDTLTQDYQAEFFREAMVRWILKTRQPNLPEREIRKNINMSLPFLKVPVYHKAKFWLGDFQQGTTKLSSNEWDVLHVRPIQPNTKQKSPRFDTALVNEGQGHRIAQVKVIFELPKKAQAKLFNADINVPKYLAYVEWFRPFDNAPKVDHLFYQVKRAFTPQGNRSASIIPLENRLLELDFYKKWFDYFSELRVR
ncbi:hypothetical protein K474DRAFT_1678946 [Panus rudis PR-1116 ss-1]|nr:hypothetical protein K474DRAFT_1678946 [Panus rudis PR-1116 ss-1]